MSRDINNVLQFVSQRQQSKSGAGVGAYAQQLKVAVPRSILPKQSDSITPKRQRESKDTQAKRKELKQSTYVATSGGGKEDAFDTDAEDVDDTSVISTEVAFGHHGHGFNPKHSLKVAQSNVRQEIPAEHGPHTADAESFFSHEALGLSERHPEERISNHESENGSTPESIEFRSHVRGPNHHFNESQWGEFAAPSNRPGSVPKLAIIPQHRFVRPGNSHVQGSPQISRMTGSWDLEVASTKNAPERQSHRDACPTDNYPLMNSLPQSVQKVEAARHVASGRGAQRSTSIMSEGSRTGRQRRPSVHSASIANEGDRIHTGLVNADTGSKDGQGHVRITSPRLSKRSRSLDYHPAELSQMTYEQLKNESFDSAPKVNYQDLPAIFVNGSLSDKLDNVYSCRNNDQIDKQRNVFFSSLSLDQYEACGDLIIEKFGELLEKFKKVRQQKRRVFQELERELEGRQDVVKSRGEAIEEELKAMQLKGREIISRKSSNE